MRYLVTVEVEVDAATEGEAESVAIATKPDHLNGVILDAVEIVE